MIGLDIGSKTIKVVELVPDGAGFKLKAAGAIGVGGVEVERLTEEKDYASLAEVVKKLVSDAKIMGKEANLALSESQVFTRTLKFPLLTDQEIASAVKWEAEEYIPIPVEEAVMQHTVIERRETGTSTSPPGVSVLLVAVPKVVVEKYLKVSSLAGLTVLAVETELMSLVRSLAPAEQTVLIVDFGARSTDLAVAKNGQFVFSRSIQTAGEAFTRAVAQYLGIATAQAEEYKKTYGMDTAQLEGKVGTALEPVFRVVAEEIKKVVHYYQVEEKGQSPTTLILSGGTSGLPGVATTLTKLLGIEVVIGNPFNKVKLDPQASQSLAAYAPLYAVSVGLALRKE